MNACIRFLWSVAFLVVRLCLTYIVLVGQNLTYTELHAVLVLSRKVGERILIGDNIAITVVKFTGGGVRIGVEAPPELAVVREELASALNDADRALLPFPVTENAIE